MKGDVLIGVVRFAVVVRGDPACALGCCEQTGGEPGVEVKRLVRRIHFEEAVTARLSTGIYDKPDGEPAVLGLGLCRWAGRQLACGFEEERAVGGFVVEPPGVAVVILKHAGGVVELEMGVVEGGVEGDVADVEGLLGLRRCDLRARLGLALRVGQRREEQEDKKESGHGGYNSNIEMYQ